MKDPTFFKDGVAMDRKDMSLAEQQNSGWFG